VAGKGWRQAMLDDPYLAEGLNIHDGQVTHIAVAQALGLRHTPVRDVLVSAV
jgi:alanine dehydrogenase